MLLTRRCSPLRLGTITYLIFLDILTSIWWLELDASTQIVENVENGSVEVSPSLLRLRIVHVHLKWSNDAVYDSPTMCEIQLRLPTMVTSTGIVSVASALPMVLSVKACLKGYA